MTKDPGGAPGFSGGGNLWDGDADSEGLRYLSWVAAQFASFAREQVRWIQEDPLAGKDAATQLALGEQVEFIGRAMQEHARLRAQLMEKHSVPVLSYLATLPPGERAGLDAIAAQACGEPDSLAIVVDDLVRAEDVDVWRPRARRGGGPRVPTQYAISAKGRLRLERPPVARPAQKSAIADGGVVS